MILAAAVVFIVAVAGIATIAYTASEDYLNFINKLGYDNFLMSQM